MKVAEVQQYVVSSIFEQLKSKQIPTYNIYAMEIIASYCFDDISATTGLI